MPESNEASHYELLANSSLGLRYCSVQNTQKQHIMIIGLTEPAFQDRILKMELSVIDVKP
jgi:hypothetical protein